MSVQIGPGVVRESGNRGAETVKLGAGESVLRWLVMPHLGEVMCGEPPIRFEVQNYRTEVAIQELTTGGIDLAILRADSVTEAFQSEPIGTLRYVLTVPRSLLRTKKAAEVLEGKPDVC